MKPLYELKENELKQELEKEGKCSQDQMLEQTIFGKNHPPRFRPSTPSFSHSLQAGPHTPTPQRPAYILKKFIYDSILHSLRTSTSKQAFLQERNT